MAHIPLHAAMSMGRADDALHWGLLSPTLRLATPGLSWTDTPWITLTPPWPDATMEPEVTALPWDDWVDGLTRLSPPALGLLHARPAAAPRHWRSTTMARWTAVRHRGTASALGAWWWRLVGVASPPPAGTEEAVLRQCATLTRPRLLQRLLTGLAWQAALHDAATWMQLEASMPPAPARAVRTGAHETTARALAELWRQSARGLDHLPPDAAWDRADWEAWALTLRP